MRSVPDGAIRLLGLFLTVALSAQEAGDLFSHERWDDAGPELPAGLDWNVGGIAVVGDVDGDGNEDLAAWVADANLAPALALLFLDGRGDVVSSTEVALPAQVTQAFGSLPVSFLPAYAVGDVNRDGTPDLGVVAVGGVSFVHLSPDGGVVGSSTDTALQGDVVHADVVGDVDGDGVDDLVCSNGTLLFLDATGAIRAEVDVGAGPESPVSVAGLGDLDADGTPDAAFGVGDGVFRVIHLAPDGTARQVTEHATGHGVLDVSVAAWDLDGDGSRELAVRTTDDVFVTRITTHFLRGDGSIASSGRVSSPEDLAGGLFWGRRMDGASDGRLLVSGFTWADRLTLIPTVEPASATERNAGSNASSYTCAPPVLGSDLLLSVDTGATGHAFAIVYGFAGAVQLPLAGGQTLLCADLAGAGTLLDTGPWPGPTARIPVDVPARVDLIGFTLCTQAVSFGGATPFALSNACDLVLGF